jgi:hypothetical protein
MFEMLPSVAFSVLGIYSASITPVAMARHEHSCRPSPTESLLHVVGPMRGAAPVWVVDGNELWQNAGAVKTLWVLLRTSDELRIEGRRLDGPGVLQLRRGSDPPADVLVVENPGKQSVIPGGAPRSVMQVFAFISSHVFYPTPGCWEFIVRLGQQETRIVRDLRPAPRPEPK